jgi:hypothetical protein
MQPPAERVAVFGTRRIITAATPQPSKELVESRDSAIDPRPAVMRPTSDRDAPGRGVN